MAAACGILAQIRSALSTPLRPPGQVLAAQRGQLFIVVGADDMAADFHRRRQHLVLDGKGVRHQGEPAHPLAGA